MDGTSDSPYPETIETPRLTLEVHSGSSDEQYKSMIKCLTTPNAIKFLGFDNLTATDVDKMLMDMRLEWKLLNGHGEREGVIQRDCIYHIRPKPGYLGGGELVGFVLVCQRNDGVPPDEGWFLTDECNGSGYATEAAKGLLRYATDVLGIQEVIAWPKESNIGSVKVAERIGLSRSGQIRDRKTGELRAVFATPGTTWPPVDQMLMPEGRMEALKSEHYDR